MTKPAAVHKANGNPSKRPQAVMEAAFPDGVPVCPDHFSDAVKARWSDWVIDCAQVPGLLKRVDQSAFELMATAWEQYEEASRHIREEGLVSLSEKKVPYLSPYVNARSMAMKTIVGLIKEFGWTPNSRKGLVFGGGEDESDPLTELLRKRGSN